MTAQDQDGQGGDVGQEGDHRDHRGELAEDLHAQRPGLVVDLPEALELALLGIDQPHQGRADDVLVQHPVQAVDHRLDLAEQLAHTPHQNHERSGDQWQHRQHRQRQPPVQPQQEAAGRDDHEDRGDQHRGRLGDEVLDGVDVGGEVGQELGRRHRLDGRVGLH